MKPHQLELFSDTPIQAIRASRPKTLSMDAEVLVQWKAQIAAHQQWIRETQPVQQTMLFDVAPAHCEPDIDRPLQLTTAINGVLSDAEG